MLDGRVRVAGPVKVRLVGGRRHSTHTALGSRGRTLPHVRAGPGQHASPADAVAGRLQGQQPGQVRRFSTRRAASVLQLEQPPHTRAPSFPSLPALKHLNLSDNSIAGGLESVVAACPNLKVLELSNCRLVSLDALKPLAALAQLRKLDLQDCPLAGSGAYRAQVLSLLPQVAVLDHVGKDSQPGEEDEDDDEDDDEDEDEDEEGDEDEGDEDEEEEDDDEPGTAFLLHGNADGLADDDDFDGEEEPESEDIDEEDGEEEEEAGAAKKPRTE